MSDVLVRSFELAVNTVLSLGYVGIAILLFFENLFPPIPSELILPMSGYLASEGRMWFPAVILAATTGATTGLVLLYGLGWWTGEERLRRIIKRFGRVVFLREADLDSVVRWFERHGGRAVLLSHLMPAFTGAVAVAAGFTGMSLGWFVVYSAIGTTAWNLLIVGLGWVLGESWGLVPRYLEPLGYVGVVVIFVLFFWWFGRRREWMK